MDIIELPLPPHLIKHILMTFNVALELFQNEKGEYVNKEETKVETKKDSSKVVLNDDVLEWLQKNLSGRVGYNEKNIWFETQSDAILFQLVWSGK